MCTIKPNLLIGFHGYDIKIQQQILNHPNEIIKSEKLFDWLGNGMYFWENNYNRAMEWAQNKKKRGDIVTPAVIGAVRSLRYCLNLLDSQFIKILSTYYTLINEEYKTIGTLLPENKNLIFDEHKDKILRELDCSVIEFMHETIRKKIIEQKQQTKGFTSFKMFDSRRDVFQEGGSAFLGAGIKQKNHIQICVRNSNCILIFFLPRWEIDFLQMEYTKK